jgi:hypothetical protein
MSPALTDIPLVLVWGWSAASVWQFQLRRKIVYNYGLWGQKWEKSKQWEETMRE